MAASSTVAPVPIEVAGHGSSLPVVIYYDPPPVIASFTLLNAICSAQQLLPVHPYQAKGASLYRLKKLPGSHQRPLFS